MAVVKQGIESIEIHRRKRKEKQQQQNNNKTHSQKKTAKTHLAD